MAGKIPVRGEMDGAYLWDISRIYPEVEAWEADFARIDALVEPLAAMKKSLRDPERLLAAFEREEALGRLLDRLYVYAHLQEDQDTSDSDSQCRMARIRAKLTDVQGRLAWMTPEILSNRKRDLQQWAQSEAFSAFRYPLQKLIRRKAHTLSEKEETLLSKASELFASPARTYGYLTNADLRFPSVRDEKGEESELSDGRYVQFLLSRDRRVRRDAFSAMYDTYGGIKNTVASTLSSTVKAHNYNARIREFGSAVEASLFSDQIPEALYSTLIETVRRELPLYFRYLSLRARQLGLKQLDMYDLYVPLVPKIEVQVSYEQAKEWVLEACAPLGKDYLEVLRTAFTDGWIDVYENRGKRSGAYSSGSYETLPYVLLNYQGTLNDVFTLAHELGHSMHSWLANHHQPSQTAGYPIFIAEIASTLNEELLLRHLLKQAEDPAFRAYLLNHYCDSFKGTVYRQTMFAEFERVIHAMDAGGEPLTHETLSEAYAGINRDYFGAQVEADPRIALEWARIPHFYYNFYVYKYATSFCASQIFADRVLESEVRREQYLELLRAGGADDPLTLIRTAGVDLTDQCTMEGAFNLFGKVLGELEEALEPQG
ncbi:MAG: oligoendopeptidase F [Kiritimatiellae bacterium]|nr:oligoendopeptidase F [Kiritimatiellia bacterium]